MYSINVFFDFGSGICLWADNEASQKRFGYPIAPEALPISRNLQVRATFLVSWWDTFLDWDSPPKQTNSEAETEQFGTACEKFVELIRSELGEEYVVHHHQPTKP